MPSPRSLPEPPARRRGHLHLAVFTLAILPALLAASGPMLEVEAGDAGTVSVTVVDGNHGTWRLQSSSDLEGWTDSRDVKVHNGHYAVDLPVASGGGRAFYRAVALEGAEASTSTFPDALLLASTPASYAALDLPAHLLVPEIAAQDNEPTTNPVTDAGAELGRVLFHDRRLSRNGTISCASCHQAEHGFSDPRPFSVGFEGGLTGRNSMGLASARYYVPGRFFWDERAATLEDQVLRPIQDEVEMGLTLPELESRVRGEPYYATLFQRAFGDTAVTSNRIARALAQFVRSIVSSDTKYDRGVATNFANFTAEELRGLRLFRGQEGAATCRACHGTDNFVADRVFNNGLENPYVDRGVGEVTERAQDEGRFKAPSLRNIALTAPYMHDGRFATLEEVVAFYDSGVVAHPNLSGPLRADPPPQPGQPPGPVQPLRLNFTADQRAALVAFLKTLSDDSLATDPRFADPFRYQD